MVPTCGSNLDIQLTDAQKYQHVLQAILSDVASLITGILINPPDEDRYPAHKNAILQALGKTKLSYLRQLDGIRLGDRRPSSLMACMQTLNTASGLPIPEELLRHRHLNLIPQEIRLHLATLPGDITPQMYLEKADLLYELLVHPSQTANPCPPAASGLVMPFSSDPRVNSAQIQCTTVRNNTSDSSVVLDKVLGRLEETERRLSAPQCPHISAPAEQNNEIIHKLLAHLEGRAKSLTPSTTSPRKGRVCFYHHRYGAQARRAKSLAHSRETVTAGDGE